MYKQYPYYIFFFPPGYQNAGGLEFFFYFPGMSDIKGALFLLVTCSYEGVSPTTGTG